MTQTITEAIGYPPPPPPPPIFSFHGSDSSSSREHNRNETIINTGEEVDDGVLAV